MAITSRPASPVVMPFLILAVSFLALSSASALFPSTHQSPTLQQWSASRLASRISYAPLQGARRNRRILTDSFLGTDGDRINHVSNVMRRRKLPDGVTPLLSSDNAAQRRKMQATATAAAAATKNIAPHWDDLDAISMCSSGAKYCGVMHEPIAVYLLWYGRFTAAQKQIMRTFIESLNSSNDTSVTGPSVPGWWNINRLYYDAQGNHISGSVTLKGELDDVAYSKGSTLYNTDVADLVSSAVTAGNLPNDPNGVYFVLGDPSVAQEDDSSYQPMGFCTSYCGWHAYTHDSLELIISFVGNAVTKCPEGCIPPYLMQPGAVAPNGDAGMDGMVSVLAHELAEATSSPYLATWFDSQGEENADICAGQYGDVAQDASTGAYYNLEGVQGSKFIVQANLNPVSGRCVVQAAGPEAAGSPAVPPPTTTDPSPSPPPVTEPPVTTPSPPVTVPEPPVTIPSPPVTVPEPPVTVPEPPVTVTVPEQPPVTDVPTQQSVWESFISFINSLFGF